VEGVQLSIFDDVEVQKPAQVLCAVEGPPTPETQPVAAAPVALDILSKFDAVKIEKSSLITEEDREFCEGMQQRLDAAVSLILKAKQFYQDNEMSNIFLSTKNLIKDLDEKLESKIDSFVNKIVGHFRSTYSVTINTSKFRKYDHTVTYKEIVDDILLQMNGMNFAEKAREEIKNAVRETIYNSSKVKVQSVKVSIADYLYFEEWFGNYRNNRSDTLAKLLKGIELFESGSTVVRDTLARINASSIRDDWFDEFTFTFMHKFQSLKCFKNGKVELKFKSHELAMEFARDYLKYT
jgi:hypothetical protein